MNQQELLDRESIRQTMAAYTTAGDRLRVEEFVKVFAEDAVLESEGVPEEDAFCYRGIQEIENWMTRWRSQASQSESSTHQATFVRHHLSTCDIQFVDEASAKCRTYWTAYTDIGADHCGYYLDTFKKVGEQWLIAHRRIRLDWRSPNSLMFTAITRTR